MLASLLGRKSLKAGQTQSKKKKKWIENKAKLQEKRDTTITCAVKLQTSLP